MSRRLGVSGGAIAAISAALLLMPIAQAKDHRSPGYSGSAGRTATAPKSKRRHRSTRSSRLKSELQRRFQLRRFRFKAQR